MNLELIETDDLVQELMNRFEHAIFAGLKTNEAHESQYEYFNKTGNTRTCQGLCHGAAARMERYRLEMAEPTSGDTP